MITIRKCSPVLTRSPSWKMMNPFLNRSNLPLKRMSQRMTVYLTIRSQRIPRKMIAAGILTTIGMAPRSDDGAPLTRNQIMMFAAAGSSANVGKSTSVDSQAYTAPL